MLPLSQTAWYKNELFPVSPDYEHIIVEWIHYMHRKNSQMCTIFECKQVVSIWRLQLRIFFPFPIYAHIRDTRKTLNSNFRFNKNFCLNENQFNVIITGFSWNSSQNMTSTIFHRFGVFRASPRLLCIFFRITFNCTLLELFYISGSRWLFGGRCFFALSLSLSRFNIY